MTYRIQTSSRSPRTLSFDNAPRIGSTQRKAERIQRRKLMFWRAAAIVQGYALITLAIIHFIG